MYKALCPYLASCRTLKHTRLKLICLAGRHALSCRYVQLRGLWMRLAIILTVTPLPFAIALSLFAKSVCQEVDMKSYTQTHAQQLAAVVELFGKSFL